MTLSNNNTNDFFMYKLATFQILEIHNHSVTQTLS